MARRRKSRIVAKEPEAALDALSEAWNFISRARRYMDKAHAAIGNNSKWLAELSIIHKDLYKCQLLLEDVVDDIKTHEKEKKRIAVGAK